MTTGILHIPILAAVWVAMATVVNGDMWDVTTVTGNHVYAGTVNDINLIIFGTKGSSPDLELNHDNGNKNSTTNTYTYSFGEIGEVGYLLVGMFTTR